MSDKICITWVRRFNAELFHRQFRIRMLRALFLTLSFVCLMVYVVVWLLGGAL